MSNHPQSLVLNLPPSLGFALQTYQHTEGLDSLESAALKLLQDFFQSRLPSPQYAPLERLEQLENQVSQLLELEEKLRQVLSSPSRENPLFVSSLRLPITKTFSSSVATRLVNDDVEDEPDEILTDFLPVEER